MLYWRPAFIIYTKALNIQNLKFIRMPLPWWRIIILGVKGYIVVFIIYLGLKFIIDEGVLGQNLIYSIAISSQ